MKASRRIHWRRFHVALFLLPILLLAACDQMSEIPQQTRQAIKGDWKQADGPASLHFYTNATVMVRLPAHNPPLSFLSSYDLMKDGRISIETGDVWQGPIICDWRQGAKVMQVAFPDKGKIVLKFIKQ